MVVKTGGTDRELGATIFGRPYAQRTPSCHEAARLIQAEIEGWPRATSNMQTYPAASQPGAGPDSNPMDIGGRFLANGGCAYIDLGHPEICTAECRSASQYAACVHGMLAIMQDAIGAANTHMPDGEEIAAFVDK